MYQENKKVLGHLDDIKMKSYEKLTFNVPDYSDRVDHKARMEKGNSKICIEWYILKYQIDEKMKQIMGDSFEKSSVCFCCQKDLESAKIYGNWNGIPWLCHDSIKLKSVPTPSFEELMEKVPKEKRNLQ